MSKTPLERIRIGAVVLGLTMLAALVGYRLLGRTWLDSLYMLTITVSSVGYTEESNETPLEKIFTIAVILFGMSAAVYTIGGFIQMMAEGEIERALGRHRMSRGIDRLKEHVIICGFGRIGQILARELAQLRRPFVVIDQDPDHYQLAIEARYLALMGDATEEEILIQARIAEAQVVVSSLPNDAANVFITLTSRNINKDLFILARAEYPSSEKKLIQAGANRVVMPASIGAQRMVRMITRPITADLMALFADRTSLEVEMDELTLHKDCLLVGRTMAVADTRRLHQLLIVAVKKHDGEMVFNPGDDYEFVVGDTIIIMGRTNHIDEFQEKFAIS